MKRFSNISPPKAVLIRMLLSLYLVLTSSVVFAQNGTIRGKITDIYSNESLIGASALIKGTTIGSASDFDGNYSITNVQPGTYTLISRYISYKALNIEHIIVEAGKETIVDIQLESANVNLQEVVLVAKANRESENLLLLEQKQALIAVQAVGAKEMSRKGISDAEAAVVQVSGVSKQNGVKNVFVRGLGDRYNFTTLNGFPIPSEDPEYKNISLDFFGSDIIQNVGVNKVFSSTKSSDVGGAIIDISSKELVGDKEFNLNISGGFNSQTLGSEFIKADGVNILGFSTNIQPGESNYKTNYNYGNSLEPHNANLALNNSYGFSGGKSYKIGQNSNPLSFYVVGSYSTKYSYTTEKIYDTTSDGTLVKNLDGKKSTQNINQLLLGNINFMLNRKHQFNYNFMLVHDNSQYVGDYLGSSSEFVSSVQDNTYEYQGYLLRQQTNDNTLIVNQLITDFKLSDKLKMNAGLSYNIVKGIEPDRRVNKLFQKNETEYQLLAGDGSHIRNYTQLIENDLNGKVGFIYELPKKFKKDISSVSFGYNGRFVFDNFAASEYSMIITGLSQTTTIEDLKLDNLFNQSTYDNNKFKTYARISNYQVNKFINSLYANLDYQFNSKFTSSAGLKAEKINLNVDYYVEGGYNGDGTQTLQPFYILPNLNLKYDLNNKNTIRLGLSKTYTLPQSKEISPYQYLGLSFSSQGNQDLQPSDNYNADLKWDYYLSQSELISFNGFYKYIKHPIARAYEANGAGYFTYDNISDHAIVSGLEMEIRKNIINKVNTTTEKVNKFSLGLNASYIYSNMLVEVPGSATKYSGLEGAAPYIVNFDLSYKYAHKNLSIVNSLVFNYLSDRIYTIGLGGFEDVIEKGIYTLNFVSTVELNKHINFNFKAKNILDSSFELTREASDGSGNKILNSYKKGMDISLGFSYKF